MLNVRKGYDVDYYLDATERPVQGAAAYYTDAVAAGEPAGIWYGRGAEALGLSGEVDPTIMKALYTHGLDPRDEHTADQQTWHRAPRYGNPPRNYKSAEEIYAGLLEQHPDAGPEDRAELRAQAGASARQSVALYDLTLSASKSHTLMWVACERAAADAAAAGDPEAAARYGKAARVLEEALLTGHRAMLDFMADKAGYARAGHHGGGAGKWVDAHDWTTAVFLQHDSREHDPHLHAHGATLTKSTCEDGKVRTIDFSLILQWRDAAGAVGDRVTEAAAWQGLDEIDMGLRLELAGDGTSRQITGVDAEATNLFSKRTAAITPTLAALERQFRAEKGRPPTNREHAALAERASSQTRANKVFGAETRDGQLARWADEYDAAFGADIAALADRVLSRAPGSPEAFSERDVITRAVAEMEGSRQSWTRSNLFAAVNHALPANLGIPHERVVALLEGLTDKAEALARHLNPRVGPEGLGREYYRADGESVFVKPHSARYATPEQLLGEEELRAAAITRGAPAWADEAVDDVIARFARAGRELSTDQETALRGILTSGAAVEVLNAPAGTGKSFLVGALADIWPLTGQPLPGPDGQERRPDPHAEPGPRVFGVAYGQRQAEVLSEEGVQARNIRAWLDGQARLAEGRAKGNDETFRLRAGDMLVVDEAGAAATPDLVAIKRQAEQAGVKLLLTGDTKQIGSPGAGGAFADIAERGITYELAEVRRFHHQWEGPASLRLRDGDTTVVGEYAKHGRLVDAGSIEQAEQAAGRAWLADTLDGRDALVIVNSNASAARLSNQLRGELVRLGRVAEQGVPLGLGPDHTEWRGTVAGVGDLVQARRNAWHLEGWSGNAEPAINRQTYRVLETHPTGSMTVARVTGRDEQGGELLASPLLLPASYVRERVTLAYAATVNAAHGRTIHGAGYGVLAPGTDGPSAYVMSSRGTDSNVLFVVTQASPDTAETGETARTARRTPGEVVADVIRPPEVDPNRTALRVAEDAADEARATATHVDPLVAVVADAIEGRTSRWLDELAATGQLAEHHRQQVAADDARRSLEQLLRTVELAGHDPRHALDDAVTASSLGGSTSVAQVLHFRIRQTYRDRLTPDVHGYGDLLPAHLSEQARSALQGLAAAADARRAELGARLAEQPPQWAREALGPVPDRDVDPEGRRDWQERAGWAASYRELVGHDDDTDALGAAPPAGLAEKVAVFHAAHRALDLPDVGADEEQMSEGRLRAHWAAWQRELATAPRYVADELDATHDAHRQAVTDATIWDNRAQVEDDPLVRDELAAAAGQARDRAAQLAVQIDQLTYADQARTEFLLDTAVTRDHAERARTVAGLNGINLDDTSDRVTATEWLDAHLDAQAADDADRDITGDDVDAAELTADPRHSQRDRADSADDGDAGRGDRDGRTHRAGDEVEALAIDLRDTLAEDPTERADPAVRRRVLPPDEATATLQRAQLLMTDLVARREAEQAAAAHAAELEPEDEQLRAELARQDALTDDAAEEQADGDDEAEALHRNG